MARDAIRHGGCRCGRLRFRLSSRSLLDSICHCTGCQRMTGGAFSVTTATASDSFEVVSGDPVVGGIHGEQAHHYHCDWCKSWVFTRLEPDLGFVNVRAAMLDDPGTFTPFVEMQVAERRPWVHLAVERSYDRFPPMEEYPAIIADFATWRSGGESGG